MMDEDTDCVPENAFVIARIEVIRYMTKDSPGDVTVFRTVDGEGGELPLVECLGMLRLTENSILRMRLETCAQDDEDEDDDEES